MFEFDLPALTGVAESRDGSIWPARGRCLHEQSPATRREPQADARIECSAKQRAGAQIRGRRSGHDVGGARRHHALVRVPSGKEPPASRKLMGWRGGTDTAKEDVVWCRGPKNGNGTWERAGLRETGAGRGRGGALIRTGYQAID